MSDEEKRKLNNYQNPDDMYEDDEENEQSETKPASEDDALDTTFKEPKGKEFNKKLLFWCLGIFLFAVVIGFSWSMSGDDKSKKKEVDTKFTQSTIPDVLREEASNAKKDPKDLKKDDKDKTQQLQSTNMQVKPLNPVIPYVDPKKYENYSKGYSAVDSSVGQTQTKDTIGFFNMASAQGQQGQAQSQQQGQEQQQGQAQYDQNQQAQKQAFLEKNRNSGFYNNTNMYAPVSEYELKAGSIIPGILITGINSDLPGQVIGQVSQNVYDTVSGDYLLIPQGTKVIGEYDSSTSYNQERVLIAWTRLIFPNGVSVPLVNMGASDVSGYAGLTDKVNKHENRLIGAALLTSVLAAGAQIASGNNSSGGSVLNNQTNGQLAVSGAAQAISQVGQQMVAKDLNIQPTITVEQGYRFNIIVNKDMLLMEY